MHGEKQQIFPSIYQDYVRFFNIYFACVMAAHGLGTSKNKASALKGTPSILNPSLTTSLQVDVTLVLFRFSKNYFVISALYLLN